MGSDTLQVSPNFCRALISSLPPLFKSSNDYFFQCWIQLGIQVTWSRGTSINNGTPDFRHSTAGKSRLARGHFVEHCSEGEEICPSVELFSPHLFRRHICWRTASRVG